MRDLITANRSNVDATVANARVISDSLRIEIPRLAASLDRMAAQMSGTVGENREDVRHIVENLRTLSADLKTTTDNLNAVTGQVLFVKSADQRRPVASLTKIMTAILVLQARSLGHVVTVHADALGLQPSTVGLVDGERMSPERCGCQCQQTEPHPTAPNQSWLRALPEMLRRPTAHRCWSANS